jgi:hypothetical protein
MHNTYMFIINAKMFYYYMDLLFVCVCMLFSYVITFPRRMYSLTSWRMSLVWAFSVIVPACVSFLGVSVLLSVVKFVILL